MGTILDRYILRSILGAVLVVMLAFLTLGGLFVFIGQQDDIGSGNYTAADAFVYVLLNLPQQAWELLPISALIGSLAGLGTLARGSELTVMRSAGLSVWRIAASCGVAGLLIAAFGAILGELVAPPMLQIAKQEKAFGKYSSNFSFSGGSGAWFRAGNLILNVEQQTGGSEFGGMTVFELADARRLAAVGRAATASASKGGHWQLRQYVESRFAEDSVIATRTPERAVESNVGAEFLGIAAMDPWALPALTLRRLIVHLRSNDLDSREAVFAFWSRIARTTAVVFAVLLAVPFVFGSLRSAGSGARTMLGLVIGVAFFLLQRVLETGTVVFDVAPFVLAWIPAVLMAAAALLLIARTR